MKKNSLLFYPILIVYVLVLYFLLNFYFKKVDLFTQWMDEKNWFVNILIIIFSFSIVPLLFQKLSQIFSDSVFLLIENHEVSKNKLIITAILMLVNTFILQYDLWDGYNGNFWSFLFYLVNSVCIIILHIIPLIIMYMKFKDENQSSSI